MSDIVWPDNFPDVQSMFELLQKMSKASWGNDSEFTSDLIHNWLDNFTGEVYDEKEEKRLALWLLCNFTYYNENEINHLCHIVFKQLLHDLSIYYCVKNEKELNNVLKHVYFAAMGDASESGGLLLYSFRQQANLSIKKFFYPSTLPSDKKGIIVFIDDVTLSGESATSFFKKNLEAMEFDRAYYITLFASKTAIERISNYGINLIQSTVLGERERCFSNESLIYSDFPELRSASEKMAKAYGLKLFHQSPLGYKNGQYCFGLYYNTPNNTLPIFWSDNKWTPIFPRKEKMYGDQRNITFDKYI